MSNSVIKLKNGLNCFSVLCQRSNDNRLLAFFF